MKEKRSTKIFALLLAGLLCVFLGGCGQEKTPEAQALKAIKSGDYDEALTIIGENAAVVQDGAVVEQLETRIAELQSAYENESMKYDDVAEELSAIARLNVPNVWTEMQEAYEYVENLYLERNFQKVWLCTSKVTKTYAGTTQTTWDYDDAGRLTGYSIRTEEGKVDYYMSYVFEYDSDGKLSGVVLSDDEYQYCVEAVYSGDQLVRYVGETGGENDGIYFGYDEDGKLVKQEIEVDSERTTLMEMSYHRNGELAEQLKYTGSHTLLSKFDENGYQIENAVLGWDDYLSRTIMEYNADGKLSYQVVYGMDALKPEMEARYEYDSEGHISVVSGQSDGKAFYSEGVWDSVGDSMAFLNLAGFYVRQYYDEYGNLTSNIQYDGDDLVTREDMEYIMLYLPFDYEKPDLNDSRYLFNIDILL